MKVRRLLRRAPGFLWRRSRAAIERAWHPVWRHQAGRRVAALGVPKCVLFVCYGNVCRSPYAEAVFRQRLAFNGTNGTRVGSAGFIGPDRAPPKTAIEAAHKRGIDLTRHVSRLVTTELVGEADVIVVMNEEQRQSILDLSTPNATTEVLVLGDLDPSLMAGREIRDPWGADRDVFDQVYARVDRCIEAWLAVDTPQSA